MSLFSMAKSLAQMDWAQDFAGSAYAYPIILATHLTCIALFGGMILATNLRLLGWTLKGFTISEVVGKLRNWKRIGFFVMIGCGLLLAGSEADKYYINPYFWIKMTLLLLLGVHGLVFHRSVYYNTAQLDQSPVIPNRAKVAAALSLILWVGVVSFGRMIGYYEGPVEPLGNLHAQQIVQPASGRGSLHAGLHTRRGNGADVAADLNR